MYEINPLLAIDSYKLGHMTMYPEGTTKVYCNLTPRTSKRLTESMPNGFYDGKIVVYGVSASIQEINNAFYKYFFLKPKHQVLEEFKEAISPFIGDNPCDKLLTNISKLHDLQYLPLLVKSLPEGARINPGIPMMTITNTHPDFAWLPNYLETFLSAQIWKLSTAATIANVYKNIFKHYAKLTGVDDSFCDWQGHDFSSRGMSGIIDASRTGSAHLTSFMGSDSVSSVGYARQYYEAKGFIAGSVPATEHSVMCLGSQEGEADTFRRLFKLYPKGIVSIVSDTWDYWNTITEIALELKPEIMAREKDSMGFCKTVFRPDSGNPVDIIVGSEDRDRTVEEKGSVQCLWETFGGTETAKGYKVLDEHVGLIYGDSITPQRAVDILQGLADKGFASSNIVLGIGSYTYQYITRDTLGFAMKATYAEINGEGVQISKQPKTDSGKNSAKGMLRVDLVDGDYVLTDCLDTDVGGKLSTLFFDGDFYDTSTLQEIRDRLK